METPPQDPTSQKLSHDGARHQAELSERQLKSLDRLDGGMHGIVAALLLCLALCIIGSATFVFSRQLYLASVALHAAGVADVESWEQSFLRSGLTFLSDILFALIVLELLRTILTYLRSRSLHATLGDFLAVCVISIVRRLLLSGAMTSPVSEGPSGMLQRALSTLTEIVAILLLIFGLWALRRMQISPPPRPKEGDANSQPPKPK